MKDVGRTSRRTAAVAAMTAVALSGSPASAQLANSYWPVFQQNLQHTGQSPINGPRAVNTYPKWTWRGQQRLYGAPSVGTDGTIYIGNGKAPICAVDPDAGMTLWCATQKKGGDAGQSQPAVAANGVVYSGARDNDLWATWAAQQPDPADQVFWRFHVPHDGDVTAPPIVGPDGTIYFASNAIGLGFVYAWNPAPNPQTPGGSEKWFQQLGAGVHNSSPTLSLNGDTVYFSGTNSTVYAFNAQTGALRWTKQVYPGQNGFRQANFTVVVGPNGRLYVGARDGLHVLKPNASNTEADEVATFPTKGRMESSPALSSSGILYFGSSKGTDGTFYAVYSNQVDGNGQLVKKWEKPLTGRFQNCEAAIGADGTIYVAVHKTVYAFDDDAQGTPLWSYTVTGGKFRTGPVIGEPGVVYAASLNRRLYAFAEP